MNEQLEKFARTSLKHDLIKCSIGQRNVFARMYGIPGLDDTIDAIVDNMPAEKLDWAMTQIKTTLDAK